MRRIRVLLDRLRALSNRQRVDDEIDEELRFHLEMAAQANVRRGMAIDAARADAARRFGHLTSIKERAYDVRGGGWAETMRQDLRFGARTLRKSPAFTAAAVLSLGLGIGANTAVFSIVNAVLLRPLPVRNPSELVQLATGENRAAPMFELSYPMFAAVRDHTHSFADVFAFADLDDATVAVNGVGTLARVQFVSGNYFSALGVGPTDGRLLGRDDDRAGSPPVVLVSDRYARRRFGVGASVVGKPISVNGVALTIVGVTSPEFTGARVGSAPDVYAPFSSWESVSGWRGSLANPGGFWLEVIGRLRPGVSVASARADVNAAFRSSVSEVFPGRAASYYARLLYQFTFDVIPAAAGGKSSVRDQFGSPLRVLMLAVAILLVVTCANIAGLLTSRGVARGQEMTIRVALGAARSRIVQQLMAESALLAMLGAALGVVFAVAGCSLLRAMIETSRASVTVNLLPDARVFAFTATVCVLAVVLFGILPAWKTSRAASRSARSLAGSAGRYTSVRSIAGRLLVVAQVALSLPLVAAAALFGATLHNLRAVDTGFDRDHLVSLVLNPRQAGFDTVRTRRLYSDVTARLEGLPGVNTVATSTKPPLARGFHRLIAVGGVAPNADDQPSAGAAAVSTAYFRATGSEIVRGRGFNDADADGQNVVVINEGAAKAWFPGRDAIGQRLGFGRPERSRDREIVGIVRDGKYDDLRETAPINVYTPRRQNDTTRIALLLRATGDPARLIPDIRRVVASVAPTVPIEDLETMGTIVNNSLVRERLLSTVSSFFAMLAVLLSCVGLYGLIAFAVARRTREIGVRMAVGATQRTILRMVLADSAALLVLGVIVGVGVTSVAVHAMRTLASQLYGVQPTDPFLLVATSAGLFAAGVAASLVPAFRATRVDPVVALRTE
jgi:predicted permease